MACISFTLFISFLVIKLLTMIPNSASSDPFSYVCSNTTMFTTNSTYHKNLNNVFNSLASNATNNTTSGYHTAFAGNHLEDTAYGLFLCRGDLTAQECRVCVSNAVQKDLPTKDCPNRKVAITWYDECMVRYSNESFFDRMDQYPAYYGWNPGNITQNVTGFKETMESLMNVVMEEAVIDRSGKKFGINVTSFTSEPLFGLAQCIPVLSSEDCYQCLQYAISLLPTSKGGRAVLPSCNVRYESYPMFNDATNQQLLSPPPAISPPSVNSNSTRTPTSETNPLSGNKNVSIGVIIAVVAPVSAILIALFILGFCLIKRKAKKSDTIVVVDRDAGEDISLIESIQYDLVTLQSATHNFSEENKLGEGGFGPVYKGTLANGQEIAVKKLSTSSTQGLREFKNEALLVAKLQHRNLVKMLGFCVVGEEKLLVYEFVVNKSLDKFLFDPEKQGLLDWETRHRIIQGIARGMLYLHQDSRLTIIHRDLKASNILLDTNLNPKIADFGMAKIFGVDQSQGNTSRIVGTYGYMSPEYAMQGHFSTKSDVYSFGVIVLEIICGKRNSSVYQTDKDEDLLSYAWKQWKEGSPMELVDPTIRNSCSCHEVMRCIHLGLLCVQESVSERPTMATIVLMLDSVSVTLPVPEQPSFTIKSRSFSKFPKESGSDESSSKSAPWSVNDVSITEPEAR